MNLEAKEIIKDTWEWMISRAEIYRNFDYDKKINNVIEDLRANYIIMTASEVEVYLDQLRKEAEEEEAEEERQEQEWKDQQEHERLENMEWC